VATNSNLEQAWKQVPPFQKLLKFTSVIESPMDGTLILRFSNTGDVADTIVCFRGCPRSRNERGSCRAVAAFLLHETNDRCAACVNDMLLFRNVRIHRSTVSERTMQHYYNFQSNRRIHNIFWAASSIGSARAFLLRNTSYEDSREPVRIPGNCKFFCCDADCHRGQQFNES
jgi:hypothetical protein